MTCDGGNVDEAVVEPDNTLARESGRAISRSLPAHSEAQNADGWLNLVVNTDDPNQALDYVQRALDSKPSDPRVRASLLKVVEERLAHDPFVAYLAETDDNYIVTFRNSRPIVIPKGRPPREVFPPLQRTEGERALGTIWLLVLGLVPVGLVTLVFSPIVMERAFRALGRRGVEPSEKRLAWLTIFLAAGLGCLAELFTLLFVLHWIG